MSDVNQEHGIVTAKTGSLDFDKFPVGSRLRILPNHACMTAASFDNYAVVNSDNLEIINNWGQMQRLVLMK